MPQSNQRYISTELTHFVGSTLKNPAEQYALLKGILESGLLSSSPNSRLKHALRISTSSKVSDNTMYCPDMICFCDIPVGDLSIHVGKYSKFGLSFSKDFISSLGGSPVFYIPKTKKVCHLSEYDNISMTEYFDTMTMHLYNLFQLLLCSVPRQYYGHQIPPLNPNDTNAPKNLDELLNRYPAVITRLNWFLNYSIFSYLKFFKCDLTEEDKENYYFEREWRVLGEISFNLENVKRILLPEEYAKQFHYDFPGFYGQTTFVE
jgi:hypothetical protein